MRDSEDFTDCFIRFILFRKVLNMFKEKRRVVSNVLKTFIIKSVEIWYKIEKFTFSETDFREKIFVCLTTYDLHGDKKFNYYLVAII